MKKALAMLLTAMLLLSITACAGGNNDGDNSTPTSTPGTSTPDASTPDTSGDKNNHDGNSSTESSDNNSQDNTQNNNQNSNQNGNQSGNQSQDQTTSQDDVYDASNNDTEEDSSQYFPPSLDDNGNLTPGITVTPLSTPVPEVFYAQRAINNCVSKNTTVTMASLTEYVAKYAESYNEYYSDSAYKLKVTYSGNKIVYNYTVDTVALGKDSTTLLAALFKREINTTNKTAYEAEVDNYQSALSSISGIDFVFKTATGTHITTITVS